MITHQGISTKLNFTKNKKRKIKRNFLSNDDVLIEVRMNADINDSISKFPGKSLDMR